MIKLIYNEILKQVKKKSFIIILSILVLFSGALPFLYKAFTGTEENYPLFYSYLVEDYQATLIKDAKTDNELLNNDIINEKINIVKKAISKKEKSSNFKERLYYEYTESKIKAITLKYLINDKNITNINNDEFDFSEYLTYTKEELNTELNKVNKNINELEKVIESNDYTWYLKKCLNETSNKDKEMINLYKELISLNIVNEDDFRAKEANKIIEYYNSKEVPMTKDEYIKTNNDISYSKYVDLINKKNKELDNKISISYYAIKNNFNYSNSAKDTFNDLISYNIVIISILITILAGGIVSNEFQKGTIRLLVIRPSKRWKILLSKFLCIVSLIILFSLFTFTLSFITTGIAYGFSNLLINDLSIINNEVVKTSMLVNSLTSLGIQMIPLVFMGLLAFFLSTVINNTALSVGLSIFVIMGQNIATALLMVFGFKYIDYTFLPYLSFKQFIPSNKLTLYSNFDIYQIYYTFTKALIVLGIYSIILYITSNLVFTKKDIKN